MKSRVFSAIALVMVGAATACQGGPSLPGVPNSHNVSAEPRVPSQTTFVWARGLTAQMTPVRGTASGRMTIYAAVRMRNAPGLIAFAASASVPGSKDYRHFLTPQQLAVRFGASARDYDTVARYFSSYGLRILKYPQRQVVRATGSVAQIARAFNTSFRLFRFRGQTVIGPRHEPHFSRPLPVTAVAGLETYRPPSLVGPVRPSFVNASGYTPQQVAVGFDYSGAYSLGYDGTGVTTAVFDGEQYNPADIVTFSRTYHWAVAKVVNVVAPGAGSATTAYEQGEPALDTQTLAGLAPGATMQVYWTGDSASSGSSEYSGMLGLIQLAVAKNSADAISYSYGPSELEELSEGNINARGTGMLQVAIASLVGEGIALFNSSGDMGALGQLGCFNQYGSSNCVDYPAADPNVVAVGGVNVPLDDAGNLNGEITAWSDNTTGGGPPGSSSGGGSCNCVGSTGGYSAISTPPPWQQAALKNAPSAPYTGKRETPDIAMDADIQTATAVVQNGLPALGDGTSLAAPMATAQWALVLSACKASPKCDVATGPHPWRLGNPAPLYYAAYQGTDSGKLSYQQVFFDVLHGNNTPYPYPSPTGFGTGFPAGPGFDLVTGIGVPFGGHLINSVISGARVP